MHFILKTRYIDRFGLNFVYCRLIKDTLLFCLKTQSMWYLIGFRMLTKTAARLFWNVKKILNENELLQKD